MEVTGGGGGAGGGVEGGLRVGGRRGRKVEEREVMGLRMGGWVEWVKRMKERG